MLRGDTTGSSPEIEHEYERERGPRNDGKGLNYASFSDEGSSFDVLDPKRAADNPGGHYSIAGGSGRDNTRAKAGNGGRRRRKA